MQYKNGQISKKKFVTIIKAQANGSGRMMINFKTDIKISRMNIKIKS